MTQSDIINNNFNKAFECIKCSNAYSTGAVLSEEKLFKQIREMKRSSFDLSKFTVVGSPTITDDGVASGFSSSDYLTQSIDFSKPFKLKFKVKTPPSAPSSFQYFLLSSTSGLVCDYSIVGEFEIKAGTTRNGDDLIDITHPGFSAQRGTEYLIEIEWTGTNYTCKINGEQIYSNPSTSQILAGDLRIGAYPSLSSGAFLGSIDLKQFSITSDGVEVFNCYKTGIDIIDNIEIPYTLSKTGSKIVDVAYRDRVIDLYEQEGQAGYYTIDETNKNFTLPMGEIYGMIENKASKKEIYNKLTNCLLEVPQRIKLELNDGTLTLKAGSQVIVPNGFEADGTTPKFDYVTIESDMTTIGWSKLAGMVFAKSNKKLDFTSNAQITSGNSATLSGGNVWYDTATNTVKRCNDSSTWTSGYSFPICLATSDGSNSTSGSPFSSIDQVFNGMGYIGSTVWVDKGVKGLIPNGRNEDGSLRNIEFTTDRVSTLTPTISLSYGSIPVMLYSNNQVNYNGLYKYDEKNNLIYDGTKLVKGVVVGHVSLSNSVVTSFNPKLPSKVVDTSSLTECVAVVQTYQNGNSWYRVYSDGWCEQGGRVSAASQTVTFLKAFANTSYCITGGLIPGTTTASYEHLNIGSLTTTSFYYTCYDSYQLMWKASGYIK